MADIYLAIAVGATIHFAQPDALKVCTCIYIYIYTETTYFASYLSAV